jgi:hypothetical protein
VYSVKAELSDKKTGEDTCGSETSESVGFEEGTGAGGAILNIFP